METLQANPGLVVGPFVLICLVIAGISWLAMLGGSLKVSLGLTTEATPGYFRCTLMAFLIIAINIAVMIGVYVLVGPQPWYIVSAYQLVLQSEQPERESRNRPNDPLELDGTSRKLRQVRALGDPAANVALS